MAWVVPDSIAFTDYGKSFVKQLSSYFTSVEIIRIEERYFSKVGTKEKTSFLLCDGFYLGSSNPKEIRFKYLRDALNFVSTSENPSNLTNYLPEANRIAYNYKSYTNKVFLSTLGNLFDIKIGIVIGATNLLVFSEKEARKLPFYPKYTYPIITKGKQLNSLSINREKLCEQGKDLPLYLIDAIKLEKEDKDLYANLLSSIPEKVLLNQTFRKRTKLFGYDDYRHPDAFLTFFAQGLPKFVINENNELNSTNSVHRLYIKKPFHSAILKFIAIQFYCGTLSDNIRHLARLYGNSIHKYEPSDAKKIPILVPVLVDNFFQNNVNEVLEEVEKNIDLNNTNLAKEIAFNFIENFIS